MVCGAPNDSSGKVVWTDPYARMFLQLYLHQYYLVLGPSKLSFLISPSVVFKDHQTCSKINETQHNTLNIAITKSMFCTSEILQLEALCPLEEIKASIRYSAMGRKSVYLQKFLGFF